MTDRNDGPMTIEEYHQTVAQAKANLARPIAECAYPPTKETIRTLRRFTRFVLAGGPKASEK